MKVTVHSANGNDKEEVWKVGDLVYRRFNENEFDEYVDYGIITQNYTTKKYFITWTDGSTSGIDHDTPKNLQEHFNKVVHKVDGPINLMLENED